MRKSAHSVHAALQCRQCHQGAASYNVPADELRAYVEPTNGKPKTFDHGPSFAGRLPRAAIPQLCGDCHADVERMNRYGLPTDQLARYWTSKHGKTLKGGEDRAAVCIDCHGVHEILSKSNPQSRTYPLNVPDTCGRCHGDATLMGAFNLPVEIMEEYRQSVHGRLLLARKDTGAPTCATCHGHHAAQPPGFATVGDVCGKCHEHVVQFFSQSIHAALDEFHGCVQCHGGGEGRHFHLIERITKSTGVMLYRYAHLLSSKPEPTQRQIMQALHTEPKQIIGRVLPTCLECHDDLEEDQSLQRLVSLLETISDAERDYVQTAHRLDEIGKGVLLVDHQRFQFDNAKTHLIGLAPIQHTLSNERVAKEVARLTTVCDQVNGELDELQAGLRWRYKALIPIWGFALFFAIILYVKYKRLKRAYVKPLPK